MIARPTNDIEVDDAQRVAMHRDRGVRQLGIDAFHDANAITDEHVLQHARDMLSGYRPVPDATRASLDVVTRSLLAHRNYWVLGVDGLPHTIMLAAIGRDLRTIVSHPALDGLPLLITGVSERAFEIALER